MCVCNARRAFKFKSDVLKGSTGQADLRQERWNPNLKMSQCEVEAVLFLANK